jgi:ribonucleoside-diphosphate reductase alpha chain
LLNGDGGIDGVIKALKGIRCQSVAWDEDRAILSCADAYAQVLEHAKEDLVL